MCAPADNINASIENRQRRITGNISTPLKRSSLRHGGALAALGQLPPLPPAPSQRLRWRAVSTAPRLREQKKRMFVTGKFCTEVLSRSRVTHLNIWNTAVDTSYMTQKFRLFFVSN